MNRLNYLKILLCICLLAVGVLKAQAQSRSAEFDSTQSSILDVGREDPFAAIPRNKRITPPQQEILPELYLETITLKFLSAKDLESVVRSISSRYGSMATNENTNSLIICDTKEDLIRIMGQIRKIDRRPKQIMVEVVILDVQLKDETEIGVNWDLLSDSRYDVSYRQSLTATANRIGSTEKTSTSIGNATAYNSTGLGGEFSIISGTVRNVLHLIQEKRDAQIIASPRAMMVSGKSANIQAVEEIPYTEQSDTSGGGSMTSTEFKNVGINLQVTAVITDGNDIFLTVNTEQNVKTGESSGGVPVVDTRKANTALLLRDGQTVVIGGLRRQEKTVEVDQIPILGDLPIVGRLFKSTNTGINNSELIVLLSPHIYNEEPIPEDAMIKYNELKNRPPLSLPDDDGKDKQTQQADFQ